MGKTVMAGLVPAITSSFRVERKDVDARDKHGHDDTLEFRDRCRTIQATTPEQRNPDGV
jgi:hypothetical protein